MKAKTSVSEKKVRTYPDNGITKKLPNYCEASELRKGLNIDIRKREEDSDRDIKKFINAFNKFSGKYGNFISGFKLQRHHNMCWHIDVVMDGRLFRFKNTNTQSKIV